MLFITVAAMGFLLSGIAFGENSEHRELFFHLTSYTAETTDLKALCIQEFGATATVADWDTDLKLMDASKIKTMVQSLDITPTFNTKYYFVTRSGEKTFGSRRVYFFERHDGPAPGNWLVHDQHGGLSLGSWFDIRGQVVCRVEGSEVQSAMTAGDITSMVSSTAFLICFIVLAVAVIVLVCIVMKRCTKSKSKSTTEEANCMSTCITCVTCVPVAVVVVEADKKDTADPAEVSALQQC